jgi:RNA ligase
MLRGSRATGAHTCGRSGGGRGVHPETGAPSRLTTQVVDPGSSPGNSTRNTQHLEPPPHTNMQYQHLEALRTLIDDKLVSCRPHPSLPLNIYNYTAKAQHMPLVEWSEPMQDCRGLILAHDGEIIGRPFRKFWNYEQVADQIPHGENFIVWEKLDGSLGIVYYYAGERVVATRGSFESDQAKWFAAWLNRTHPHFYPDGTTYLFEILYPENRIVVDYGARAEAVLLSVMSDDGVDLWPVFDGCTRFRKAQRFDGLAHFAEVNSRPEFAGMEGFVVQWQSGFRAKVKLEEYKRLHRLITQCSTRTIWEMLRAGLDVQELLDRIPEDFEQWARGQIAGISTAQAGIVTSATDLMSQAPPREPRKEFAAWAKAQAHPGLLFSLLDGKDITDAAWKLVEPKWATPFRKDLDA